MRKATVWMMTIATSLALVMLTGCGEQEPHSKVATDKKEPAAVSKARAAKAKNTPQMQPNIEEEITTDGRAIFGSLVLVPPNEIRLYPHPTFPGDKRASVRGTVVVDGGSTIPATFSQIPSMEYYVALLTDMVKLPVVVTLRLSADGYKEAEIKTMLAAVAPAAEKSAAVVAASNPREYTKLILLELARLEDAVGRGALAFTPEISKQVMEAVSGLALTSNERTEMALQPALTALNTAVTSMTDAKKRSDVGQAKAVLEEVKKIIDQDVRPHFVSE